MDVLVGSFMLKINNVTFIKTIIIFWTFWWFIVLWTDVVGGFAHLGILKTSWAPDTNYPLLADSLKMYQVAYWVPPLFFLAIITWSFFSAAAFCWASIGLLKPMQVWMPRVQVAFIISLTYWLAFFIADQIVMQFDLEENHMVQGGFQFMTYLALYLLPETKPNPYAS